MKSVAPHGCSRSGCASSTPRRWKSRNSALTPSTTMSALLDSSSPSVLFASSTSARAPLSLCPIRAARLLRDDPLGIGEGERRFEDRRVRQLGESRHGHAQLRGDGVTTLALLARSVFARFRKFSRLGRPIFGMGARSWFGSRVGGHCPFRADPVAPYEQRAFDYRLRKLKRRPRSPPSRYASNIVDCQAIDAARSSSRSAAVRDAQLPEAGRFVRDVLEPEEVEAVQRRGGDILVRPAELGGPIVVERRGQLGAADEGVLDEHPTTRAHDRAPATRSRPRDRNRASPRTTAPRRSAAARRARAHRRGAAARARRRPPAARSVTTHSR